MHPQNSLNTAYSSLDYSQDRERIDRDRIDGTTNHTAPTRSNGDISATSLLFSTIGSLFTNASGHDGLVNIDRIQPTARQGNYVSGSVVIQYGDWAPGKNNKGISTDPGDGFLEAFKTLIHAHPDWFLDVLKRHHSTG
jgi:hypothetical protein